MTIYTLLQDAMKNNYWIFDEEKLVEIDNKVFEKIDYTCEYTGNHYRYREFFSCDDYDYVGMRSKVEALDKILA